MLNLHESFLATNVILKYVTLSCPMTLYDNENFSFVLSLATMSLGDRFCVSRKSGGGGWAHLQGGKCSSMFVLSFGWHLECHLCVC